MAHLIEGPYEAGGATFTRAVDGSITIVTTGGLDPSLTADEAEELEEWLFDSAREAAKVAKAQAKAQAKIDKATEKDADEA
jgi:type IV secretory pathway VirB9-like protein